MVILNCISVFAFTLHYPHAKANKILIRMSRPVFLNPLLPHGILKAMVKLPCYTKIKIVVTKKHIKGMYDNFILFITQTKFRAIEEEKPIYIYIYIYLTSNK